MKIIVNDANILIDLISIDLLDTFLNMDFEFHTNDFIINEISDELQKNIIEEIIETNRLIVAETKSEEYAEIVALMTKNLSFEDCSIWHYTKKVNGVLLTGDARLRKSVEQANIEVKGILFVFDVLMESGLLKKGEATEKLIELSSINNRLPKFEIEKRLTLWKTSEKL